MKRTLLILTITLLVGCKTENIYLTILPVTRITETMDTIYIVNNNRFKGEFQRADSIFNVIEKASDDAMKSAILKFGN